MLKARHLVQVDHFRAAAVTVLVRHIAQVHQVVIVHDRHQVAVVLARIRHHQRVNLDHRVTNEQQHRLRLLHLLQPWCAVALVLVLQLQVKQLAQVAQVIVQLQVQLVQPPLCAQHLVQLAVINLRNRHVAQL